MRGYALELFKNLLFYGIVVFSSSCYDFYVLYMYRPMLLINNRKSLIYSIIILIGIANFYLTIARLQIYTGESSTAIERR